MQKPKYLFFLGNVWVVGEAPLRQPTLNRPRTIDSSLNGADQPKDQVNETTDYTNCANDF